MRWRKQRSGGLHSDRKTGQRQHGDVVILPKGHSGLCCLLCIRHGRHQCAHPFKAEDFTF
jgi:hypothetical protein